MRRFTRRTALGGGVAAAVAAAVPLVEQTGAQAAPAAAGRALTWHLGDVHLAGARTRGVAATAHATLRDAHGTPVGVLRHSATVADAGGTVGGTAGDLATQVLDLGHATLVGVGLGHGRTLEGSYAVVGGTGTHAGARGSYTIAHGVVRATLLG